MSSDRFLFRAWVVNVGMFHHAAPALNMRIEGKPDVQTWELRSTDFSFFGYANEDEITIMQSMDMRDCSGKVIYEGDIVRITDNVRDRTFLAIAKYDSSAAAQVFIELPRYYGNVKTIYAENDVEVIGNTYESPELLEAAI